jgi:sarcosine oxidase
MITETADVVVVGLGAVGSACLHRLAIQGARVVGIDRFHPPHDQGSTHGETRITRLAVGEGSAYAPLVRRSHEIWRELEAATGLSLLLQTGGLIMAPRAGTPLHHGSGDFVRRSIAVAEENAIPHEVLDADAISARFPQFVLNGDELALYEPSAGIVFAERCVAAQLDLARALGATTHLCEQVLRIDPLPSGVAVVTNHRTLHTPKVILAAGPWLPGLAGGKLAQNAHVYRQTLHWFPVTDPAAYFPDRFPIFIWLHGATAEDFCYGFPSLPGTFVLKAGTERYTAPIDPDNVDRVVTEPETDTIFRRHIAGRLRGVGPASTRSTTCLYTVTPDAGFIIDELPDHPEVLVASACSGHGFKHSAAIGELLASRALSTGAPAEGPFSLARF